MKDHLPLMLRIIYAICLLGATFTHASMLLTHGLSWDYGGVPKLTSIYWTLLTFIDPLAVILLFMRPRLGVGVTAVIILTNVAHNMWFMQYFDQAMNWVYASQIVFLIFVACTIQLAWQGLARPAFKR